MWNYLRIRLVLAALLALVAWASLGAAATAAAAPNPVTITATVNGQNAAKASAGDPLRLEPGETVEVVIELTNGGRAAIEVRHVEISGRVIGLTFFRYDTAVQFTVEPGATDTLRYRLELYGLAGQATGLIGGELAVADAKGNTLASIPTVTDVRGSLMSVYGLFGIALAVFTVLALLDAGFGLAKHRLSENRWQRGLRLLAPGIGIGLVIAFSASVARLWVPDTGQWLALAGLTAAAFFTLGYFSPTPHHDEDEDLDEDDDLLDADTVQSGTDEVGR